MAMSGNCDAKQTVTKRDFVTVSSVTKRDTPYKGVTYVTVTCHAAGKRSS